MRLACAFAALGAASLSTPAASAQQDLFALARLNAIWRIDGFDTANPVPTLVVNWGVAPGSGGPTCDCGPVGLEVDPLTGDFLVLVSSWSGDPDGDSELLRVDPQSGLTNVALALPFSPLSGLERRWDGKYITIKGGSDLLTFDLTSGVTDVTPMSAQLQFPAAQFSGFDLDASGYPQFFSVPSSTVDPVTGAVSQNPLPTLYANSQSALAITSSGEYYGATFFPGSIHRYDSTASVWNEIVAGYLTTNNVYDLALTNGVDGLGYAEVCPGIPNSTGSPATMEFLGLADVGAQDLQLVTRGLPASSFGFYLMGMNQANIGIGAGQLCIGPTIHRYLDTLSAVQSIYSYDVDLMDLPNGQPAMPGSTQIFQFWFRDTVHGFATSNFSAAASVTFR